MRAIDRGNVEDATRRIEAIVKTNMNNPGILASAMAALLRAGSPEDAPAIAGKSRRPSAEILKQQARAEAALGMHKAMLATLIRLRGASSGNASALGHARLLEARLEAQLGHVELALDAFEKSDLVAPHLGGLSEGAQMAARHGLSVWANRMYDVVCARDPDNRVCATRERNGALNPIP